MNFYFIILQKKCTELTWTTWQFLWVFLATATNNVSCPIQTLSVVNSESVSVKHRVILQFQVTAQRETQDVLMELSR